MKKKIFVILVLLSMTIPTAYSQMIDLLEFRGVPASDVLQALAKVKGKSIVVHESIGDDLVDFTFRNMDVDRAFNLFLAQYDLFLEERDSIYFVSRFSVRYNKATGMISIDSEGVDITRIINAISDAIDKTIQYDPLPAISPPVHNDNITPKDLLELLLTRAPDYKLNVTPFQFYIENMVKPEEAGQDGKIDIPDNKYIIKNGNFYSISQTKKRFQELLRELFFKEKKEYVLLMKRDLILDSLMYDKKSFEELLIIILQHANADYSVSNGIYYIFEIQQRDILKSYKNYEYVQLHYITPQDVQRIMPPELGSSKFYRINQSDNSLILSGSKMEIEPIKSFIKQIDRPLAGNKYIRYDLNFLKANNIKTILPNKYKQMEIMTIPDSNAIVMLLDPEGKKYMDELLNILDRRIPSRQISLKYIKAEDLVKNLPPSVSKEDIVQTGNESVIFFIGTDEKYEIFEKELTAFDQPIQQIRYQVLVLAHTEDESVGINENNEVFTLSSDANNTFSASVSNLISLGFNIPSVLGVATAVTLSVGLNENTTRVMTDTTLYGISGEKVSFNDTDTTSYKFTEPGTESSEGTTPTTVTKDVSTGFKLSIEGWVSGDDMVSMQVDISLSKAGQSDGADVLSTTSERNLTTTIRTSSGEPIKIGGLIKQDTEEHTNKIPFLGDIPYLGIIFRTTNESVRKSEVVVYILPQIVKPVEELEDTGRRIENLYNSYIK